VTDRRTETRGVRRAIALSGGSLAYTLRTSARSRGIRVTIDATRGVLVSVPPPERRGWTHPEPRIEAFLAEREGWIRRHIARSERTLEGLRAGGPLGDGGWIRYLGEPHRLHIRPAPANERRSIVERRVVPDGPRLTVDLAPADRRSLQTVLRDWCRERAAEAIDLAISAHASALAVRPGRVRLRDPRTRWGSASRSGALSFSWRLVLAPPEALETVVVHELAHLRVFGHGPRFWAIVAGRRADHAVWRRWLREHALELHLALTEPASD